VTDVLFICTGNTCRSPLAEALLRRKLADRGVEGVVVGSAGTGAWEGAPASEGAYLVGLEHGLDLSEHRARLLTRELASAASLILTMARHHRARVEQLDTTTEARVLGDYSGRGDIEVVDPFGGDLDLYREVFAELDGMLESVADRLARERLGDRR
jgi:protein-tyrosine-phosphatase